MNKYKFKLPAGCTIGEVVLRETNGEDEMQAMKFSKAQGATSSIVQELMRLAICEVDGKPAEQPFQDDKAWNSRTRSFVLKAYLKINSVEDEEEKGFLSGMVPL